MENDLTTTDFSSLKSLDEIKLFAKEFILSELCPYKKVEDVVIAIVFAQQMGLNSIHTFAHLAVINNKAYPDTHLIRLLLQRNNVFAETIKDYEPVYSYVSLQADNVRINFPQKQIDMQPDRFEIVYSKDEKKVRFGDATVTPEGKTIVFRSLQPVDYETVVLFSRYIFNPMTKQFQCIKEEGKFSVKEAETAGLLEKNNWKLYLGDCLYARAYMRGARRIAGDYTGGSSITYSAEEAVDFVNFNNNQ